MDNLVKKQNIAVVYFSPNGKAKIVADSVKQALDLTSSVTVVDLTIKQNRQNILDYSLFDFVAFCIPVYNQGLPKTIADYFNNITSGAKYVPYIMLSCYGNVNCGALVKESNEILENKNFLLLAYGHVVVQHTYNINGLQIGQLRPAKQDLDAVQMFSLRAVKLLKDSKDIQKLKIETSDIEESKNPFAKVITQKKLAKMSVKVRVNAKKCTRCGECRLACPLNEKDEINMGKNPECIRCLACYHACQENAIKVRFSQPFIKRYLVKYGTKPKASDFTI